MKRRILYLLLPTMLLAGCDKDESGGEPATDDRIRFEIGFAPQDAAMGGAPETRTATAPDFKTTWETGDEIGVYIVKGSDGLQASGNYADNVKFIRQSNGTWSYTLPTGREYYPTDGDKLHFFAYYPYDAAMSAPTAYTFSVRTDQSAEADYSLSDLMTAKAENVEESKNAVSLQFSHALSLVQVEVKREVNVPHFDGDFTVTLKGAKPDAVLGWSSNLTGTGTPTDIVMHKVAGMNYTYRALVPAQTLGAEAKVSFVQTTSGKEINMTYPGIASAVLPAKAVRKYSVTLGWGIDPDHAYAIGDAYPHTGPAVGIVYWIDPTSNGKHGRVVGLKEITGRWGVYGKDESPDVTGIRSFDDGKTATRNLIAARKDATNFTTDYFIFNWIYQTMNNGNIDGVWYLPAMAELSILYSAYNTNRGDFNDRLNAAGGDGLGDYYYWSSSEGSGTSTWGVYFGAGSVFYDNKSIGSYSARCFLAF